MIGSLICLIHLTSFFLQSTVVCLDRRVANSSCVLFLTSLCRLQVTLVIFNLILFYFIFNALSAVLLSSCVVSIAIIIFPHII